MSSSPTGVDKALSLEAIYYSAPIPRSPAVLSVLGAVFDRVHFPHVYLPTSGFDQAEVDKEIARLQGVERDPDTEDLIAILTFMKYAKVLDGFCVFKTAKDRLLHEPQVSGETLKELHEAIHGPARPGWQSFFATGYSKALPGSDEFLSYPGGYHYLIHAVHRSAETGFPIVSDVPGLPIPGLDEATPENNAKILATILAIEATKLALPAFPILRPEELMEFRAENAQSLRNFRRAMLIYAAELNSKIKGAKPTEFGEITKFFVQTEIVPSLDTLREAMNAPARPWHKRIIEGAGVLAQVAPYFFTMTPEAALTKALAKVAGQFAIELVAEGDHRVSMKRSGLYYLLSLERFHADKK
jgi:hypothetical protein